MLFEHGFYLTKPIWALICSHDVTQESVATLTDHFADAYVCENDHTCLFHCINTCRVPQTSLNSRPNGLLFKQLPLDSANVNA